MKISGAATMHAPADKVWIALNDPAVLVRTIPGCEQLEATGPDSYRLTVTAGVASIKGTYTGEVALSEKQEPASFLMTASGAGGPGTVSTSVQVRLAANGDGGTELSYDADAVIGGMIASVGQRMLVSVAKKMAREFFDSVDDVLTGRVAPAAGSQAAVAVPAPAGMGEAGQAAAVPVPGVYVAPRRPVAPTCSGFLRGVLVGAAVALAGVAVGSLLGRRAR